MTDDLAPHLRDWRMTICEHLTADICSPCLRDRILAWQAAQPVVVSAEQRREVAHRLCMVQDSIEHMEQTDDEPCTRCLAWAEAALGITVEPTP